MTGVTSGGTAGSQAQIKSQRYPVLEAFLLLAKRKSFILKCVGAASLAAIVVVLLLPNTYTANARILFSGQHQFFKSVQLGPELNLPWLNSGQNGDLLASMLRSETIADHLIDRFSLMEVYGAKLKVEARQKLASRTEIVVGKDGVISISLQDRNSQRATDLTNGYVEELQAFTKTLAVARWRSQKEFLTKQVAGVRGQLAGAEQTLRKTQEATGLVFSDQQANVLIEQQAAMQARVAAQQVDIQWLRSFAGPENPELARATQRLSALRDEESKLEIASGDRPSVNVPLEKMPSAALEYWRKFREARFREALLSQLQQQLEKARLDEAKADSMIQPVVQTLDIAVPPEINSSPHRLLIVLSTTLLALLLAVLMVFLMERVRRAELHRKPPQRVQLYSYHSQDQAEDVHKVG